MDTSASTLENMVPGVELIPVIDTQSRLMIYYRAKSGKYRLAAVSCPSRINKTPVDAQLEANICQLTQSHIDTFVGKMPRFELAVSTLLLPVLLLPVAHV